MANNAVYHHDTYALIVRLGLCRIVDVVFSVHGPHFGNAFDLSLLYIDGRRCQCSSTGTYPIGYVGDLAGAESFAHDEMDD